MLIALAQMDVKAARLETNFQKMRSLLFEAKEKGAELIAFPELCLSGYMIGDLWTDNAFCRDLERYNEKLLNLSRETATVIIYGNVKINRDKKGADGRRARYNAVYCMDKGRLHIRAKTLLPSYRVFDDRRYFVAQELSDVSPVELENGFKVGMEVCEDLWWEDYGVNVTELLLKKGADIILNISASPFTEGKSHARDNRVRHLKKLAGDAFRPFFYLNCVGVQNNGKNIITFDGDSGVYNAKGERLSPALKPYEEGIILASADVSEYPLFAAKSAGAAEQKFRAIARAYQGVAELLPERSKFIFGLSGGVDSCLSCALAALALGADRVLGFNLPTRFNSDKTKAAAKKLAENLNISYEILEIESLTSFAKGLISPREALSPLAYENLQARVRGGIMLQTLAAVHGGVVVANGNKLELALGYATLYGDTVGAFAPLGDLTKLDIWEMARFINGRFGALIPEEVIADADFECEIMPTAELKRGQRDPMWWGVDDRIIERVLSYERVSAEDILEWYRDGTLPERLSFDEKLLKKYGGDDPKIFTEHLMWFFSSLKNSVFKRVQYPPVVMLSKSSFGYDFREAIL